MKQQTILSLAAALALAPALALAADPTAPGKSGADSASQPRDEAPATERGKSPAADPTKEGGKSGDATTLPKAGADKFKGKITAVDKTAQTITIADAKMGSHTLQVADHTKGVTGSMAAAWSDLTVGTEVHGVCRKDGEKFHAESLSVSK